MGYTIPPLVCNICSIHYFFASQYQLLEKMKAYHHPPPDLRNLDMSVGKYWQFYGTYLCAIFFFLIFFFFNLLLYLIISIANFFSFFLVMPGWVFLGQGCVFLQMNSLMMKKK